MTRSLADSDSLASLHPLGLSLPGLHSLRLTLRRPSRVGRPAPAAKTERPTKPAEEPVAPAPARRGAKRSAEETRAERDSKTRTTAATPAAPPAAAESGRTLRRGRHLQSSRVSFDTKKLITLGLGAVGLIVALVVGRSLFQQAQATITQPSVVPSSVPPESGLPNEPLITSSLKHANRASSLPSRHRWPAAC